MSVHLHQGAADAAEACTADVVITTPNMLLQQSSASLRNRDYWRLVIDEAHLISNPKTMIFQALISLRCQHTWCVTGTPLQNSSGDIRSLLQLCRVPWALLPLKESLSAAAGQFVSSPYRKTTFSCHSFSGRLQ
jgi:SWI/SNF-related matrix-associated actin-dependent regulator of chromatin subfamily A3